jgi:hypothetical protein
VAVRFRRRSKIDRAERGDPDAIEPVLTQEGRDFADGCDGIACRKFRASQEIAGTSPHGAHGFGPA